MLLAIDPGLDSGWAIFSSFELIACGLGDEVPKAHEPFEMVVVEHPVIYPGGKTRDPNSIVKLAIVAGEWAGRYRGAAIRYVTPREWKGTLNPDICNARAWARLGPKEQGVVDAAFRSAPGRNGLALSKRHNVLDAIGLGLFSVDRWR